MTITEKSKHLKTLRDRLSVREKDVRSSTTWMKFVDKVFSKETVITPIRKDKEATSEENGCPDSRKEN